MAQLTVGEWNAKTEVVRGQIAEQKYIQATRQLSREKQKIKLEDIADNVLALDITRAEVGLESKKLSLQGDKIQLQGAKDSLRYLSAKQTLQQRLWATELTAMEVNLSGSEAKLQELRNIAQTLKQKVNSYVPRNLFTPTTPDDD
ncbi:MAG: hypothetical protein EA368_12390 [Leptolyngbya sp. DLM2.Bin27]|nr:MAG: hypothetical protein EA368_12390 [Leptolyngbya sp. DLM2.Bin27]